MHFLQTNAVDLNGLLIALKNFLAANGWTVLADGTGGGGLSLEMTNANGHSFQFASITQVQTTFATGSGVNFNDRLLRIAFQKSDIGLAAGYTSHPADTNDMAGPFPNLWFVTDAAGTYCHVVAQTGNARYAHFSFGDLDNGGLHAFNLPYAFGLYYQYWPIGANWATSFQPFMHAADGTHNIGFYAERAVSEVLAGTGFAARVGVPNGVVDPALGFTAGAIEAPILRSNTLRACSSDANSPGAGEFLDFLFLYDNQGYTGGVPIFPCSIIEVNPTDTAHTLIGFYPGIGQVNMEGLSPGQVLTFAGEDWIVFPIKQYGTVDTAAGGVNPQMNCNSLKQGIAIRKA